MPATLTVTLPADAQLRVDGQRTSSTSSRRVFVSPPLQPGRSYSYTLEAQVVRNGQTLSVSREVPVRAGQQTAVNLDMPTFTAAVGD
jgi:uncharacterized protein (TIGR03000 family)